MSPSIYEICSNLSHFLTIANDKMLILYRRILKHPVGDKLRVEFSILPPI